MSTPGPTIIHECSSCRSHLSELTWASGNNCGVRYWSDSRRDVPMDPDPDWLVKCPHCHTLVWIDEQTQISVVDRPDLENPGRGPKAPAALSPEYQDYFSYLASSAASLDKKREVYVRLRAWWRGNDVRRESTQDIPLSKEEIDNLREFSKLLDDEDASERLTKAEVLRELGEYAEAEDLLAADYPSDLLVARDVIHDLARKRISAVSEILIG